MKPHLYVSSLLLLAGAQLAHADALADFKTGTSVLIETATVDLGNGARSSTGSGVINKAAGSLNFTVQASDLGVELPIALHLRGTLLRDGSIDYVVSDVYSPAVSLGAGHTVSAVSGHFHMRARPLTGLERGEVGNARLILSADSSLVARTDLGDIRIEVDELAVQGGVVQPPLATFSDPSRTIVCSDRVATNHNFTVTLSSLARASGAVVELKAPEDTHVHVPSGFTVRGGRQYGTVTARIDANYVGRVRLTAASGGIQRALDVDVHAARDCGR